MGGGDLCSYCGDHWVFEDGGQYVCIACGAVSNTPVFDMTPGFQFDHCTIMRDPERGRSMRLLLDEISIRLNLTDIVTHMAFEIYMRSDDKRGWEQHAVAIACLYEALFQSKFPRTMKELCRMETNPDKMISKALTYHKRMGFKNHIIHPSVVSKRIVGETIQIDKGQNNPNASINARLAHAMVSRGHSISMAARSCNVSVATVKNNLKHLEADRQASSKTLDSHDWLYPVTVMAKSRTPMVNSLASLGKFSDFEILAYGARSKPLGQVTKLRHGQDIHRLDVKMPGDGMVRIYKKGTITVTTKWSGSDPMGDILKAYNSSNMQSVLEHALEWELTYLMAQFSTETMNLNEISEGLGNEFRFNNSTKGANLRSQGFNLTPRTVQCSGKSCEEVLRNAEKMRLNLLELGATVLDHAMVIRPPQREEYQKPNKHGKLTTYKIPSEATRRKPNVQRALVEAYKSAGIEIPKEVSELFFIVN